LIDDVRDRKALEVLGEAAGSGAGSRIPVRDYE